ncbi:hypothetical protein [Acaryochloris marina]|uniref:hypothetical protein n=1 Tax=Acaryochloris marina TaxID=155978 RepID=UPI0002E9F74B|nr:hypothetical protein [Acaryochloris marina]BDM79122.1 hypothetical protein AM10699_19900 [Acaryochloris marina MBIC10699]
MGNLLTDHLQVGVLNRYSLLYHRGQRNQQVIQVEVLLANQYELFFYREDINDKVPFFSFCTRHPQCLFRGLFIFEPNISWE